jgi:leader peptidase (prepilin peptidase) / N-methyltransferase
MGLLPALALLGLATGPWLALAGVRLADSAGRPSPTRIVVVSGGSAVLLAGAVAVTGPRPAAVAVAALAAAGTVLAQVDLAAHRLPDAVTYPAFAVCATALLVDAAVTGLWGALLRAVLAAAAAFAGAALAAALSPRSLGFGDVKLLGLLGLVLGWAGWGVLLTGILLGLLAGALGALLLIVAGRAGWRTAVPFGPPLLLGAAVALALSGSLGVGSF